MKYLDINTWNRKQHFEHFSKFVDPYFGVVVDVNVTTPVVANVAEVTAES